MEIFANWFWGQLVLSAGVSSTAHQVSDIKRTVMAMGRSVKGWVCTHTHTHTHIHTHIQIHTCTQTHTHTQTYTHTYTHTRIHTHTHIHIHTHHTHILSHTHTHIHLPVDEVKDVDELLQFEVREVSGQHVGLHLLLHILPHAPPPILQFLHHVATVEGGLHHLTGICRHQAVIGKRGDTYVSNNVYLFHTHQHAHTCTQACTHAYTCNTDTCMHTHTHTQTHTHQQIHTHHRHAHTHMHVHTHIHTCTHRYPDTIHKTDQDLSDVYRNLGHSLKCHSKDDISEVKFKVRVCNYFNVKLSQ